jgi:hypothetical protein
VEEFHGQLKIGGGKKRVLLDWRENGKRRRIGLITFLCNEIN